MDRIIEFFKNMDLYDETYFNYLKENTKVINMPYRDIIDFVGCFKIDDYHCRLILPKINSFRDELIYVHEYSHALFLDDELEIFPNIMEAYYINYYLDDINSKKDIIKELKKELNISVSNNHIVGKKIKLLNIKM